MAKAAHFSNVLGSGRATTDEALALFDALDTLDAGCLRGAWRGEGFWTDHPLDGALEAWHWQGKRFDSSEEVHPLVFRWLGQRTVSINPFGAPLAVSLVQRLPVLKSRRVGRVARVVLPLLGTRRSRARLRMMSYRGKTSATMIYDNAPIHDVFRRVDAHTVLGLMDMKGLARPLFFVLRRIV